MMKPKPECSGCPLYPNICIVATHIPDVLVCPCSGCLVKVTCSSMSQSCNKFKEVINKIKGSRNDNK
jgi:hypothetical protein